MAIEYKVDVLKALKGSARKQQFTRLDEYIFILVFGEATIQRLRHKQTVSFDVLSKLCFLLNCEIGDILIYVKDDTLENCANVDK